MYRFSTDTPPDPKGTQFQLLRTPTRGQMQGVITCAELYSVPTHFWGGRTVPCDEENCDACNAGMGWRRHCYVSLYGIKSKRHVLFEMTAAASDPLKLWKKAYTTLRGCLITAKRLQTKLNGRVIIETKLADADSIRIPEPPDIVQCLCRIWNIPYDNCTISDHTEPTRPLHVHDVDAANDWRRSHQPEPPIPDNGQDKTAVS